MKEFLTLSEFISSNQDGYPHATGELSQILNSICLAGKIIKSHLSGSTSIEEIINGGTNVHGEVQKDLDVYSHNIFSRMLSTHGSISAILSEEGNGVEVFENGGKYIIAIDPLDGSGNIDVNGETGTIFSIYRRVDNSTPSQSDFLRGGSFQIAAGYIIYGPSTMMVYTTGNGVNGFTLDSNIGTFILTHPDMKMPDYGKFYSINDGNWDDFDSSLKDLIANFRKKGMGSRYSGCLVSDFHRSLISGGVYIYPSTSKAPFGKIRLMYEANPLAFIAEQAGGIATDGNMDILDVGVTDVHQCTPIFIGSVNSTRMLFKA